MEPIRRKLTNKYLFALTLVGSLLVISYLAFTLYFKTMATDGYLINISGRQRMLSQRIAFLSSERSRISDPTKIQEIQKELDHAIETMEETHNKLVRQETLSPEHHEIYFGQQYALDRKVREFISVSKNGIQRNTRDAHPFALERLNFLLTGLDKAVTAFEEKNNLHDRNLIYIQTSILVLGIFTLIFSGVFIFRPMTSEIVEKTEKLIAERNHTSLLLEIAITANQSKTFDEAIAKALRQICAHTGWPVGHAYVLSNDDPELLLPTKLWHLRDTKSFQKFVEVTEKTPLKLGVGLPGRVLQNKEPIWILDVEKDQNFPRNKVAVNLGVHSAFAFPLFMRGNVVAVLEFFSETFITKDDPLLNIISHVGQQLGQVGEREDSENTIRCLNQTLEQRVLERTKELFKKNEELIRQQEIVASASKMSALGEMAGGIAHEINNPLSIIKMRAEQLKEAGEEGDLDTSLLIETADTIAKTATRMAKIINGLRSFSRDGKNDPFQSATLQTVVEETLDFCKEKFRNHNVNLEVKCPEDPIKIDCRSTQISQVILNLTNNAFDAIQSLNEKWVKIDLSDHGENVEISITDSGGGIPKTI
jgi:signal transduction histidine kinase